MANSKMMSDLMPSWLRSMTDDSELNKAECVLVFPKAFEEQQFLASLVDVNFTIQVTTEGKFNFNLIHWEAIGSVLAIQTVSFDSSDVLFAASLVELIHHKKNPANLLLILCGTCGADTTAKIGDCFEIQEAMKIDRGDMYLDDGLRVRVELRPSMRAVLKPKHKSFHLSATAICSNYVMHLPPSELYTAATELPSHGVVVADMETFEFFMICEKTAVMQYRALRVVSDSAFLHPSKNRQESQALARSIRKGIPMKSLVLMVNKLVSEELSNGSSYTYPDALRLRILRSAQVRFERISRPDFRDAIAYYGAANVVDLHTQWAFFEKGLVESRRLFDQLPLRSKFKAGDEEESKTAESEQSKKRRIERNGDFA